MSDEKPGEINIRGQNFTYFLVKSLLKEEIRISDTDNVQDCLIKENPV